MSIPPLSRKFALVAIAFLNAHTAISGVLPPERNGYAPVVVKDGLFVRNGKPYTAYGINDFGAFYTKLKVRDLEHLSATPEPGNRAYLSDFEVLKRYKIPFFRCPIGGFYPADWKIYLTDPEQYFKMLDGFVSDVEQEHLLFIPTLFWMPQSLSTALGEPLGAWGNATSKTRSVMRRFATEVVRRYHNSPAILGWEFSNEFLLEADLPGRAGKKLWWNRTELGFPAEFRVEDQLTRSQIRTAAVDFANTVRDLDRERPIFSGDSLPRVESTALAKSRNWKTDSPAEWFKWFQADNPSPINTVTIHWYYFGGPPGAANCPPGLSQKEMIHRLGKTCAEIGKPLFVGEFGPQVAPTSLEERRKQVREIFRYLEQEHIQLSAYWAFDYDDPQGFKCAPGSENAYVLDLLREANEKAGSSRSPQ